MYFSPNQPTWKMKTRITNFLKTKRITIEWRNLLFAIKEECTKHVFLVTARTSMWKTKQITKERGNLLFSVMKITSAQFLNEVDIDFRILGLPHFVVKQADNYRVRELVKKIENHPHRQSLQRDLQQNNAYNPFSEKSKKMIQDVDNVELCELFETDPKTQCKGCLSYWSGGIVSCTCGHLLKKKGPTEASLNIQWTFLKFQKT